jgi:altronate hydrolase
VLVALTDLKKGDIIVHGSNTIVLKEDVKAKHKLFTTYLKKGDKVIMYGVVVGTATNTIAQGSWMNTDNIKHASEPYVYRNRNYKWDAPDISKFANKTFMGYHRSNGWKIHKICTPKTI